LSFSVCVFCGSSPGRDGRYVEAAREFGGLLASRGHRLVFGGGRVGLMGSLADGALSAGGKVVGVIPEMLVAREVAHAGVELRVVESMHERKATMADLSDAFVALPGGIGTLEELFEVWTWSQLGIHAKPCGLLDVSGYYGALLDFLAHGVDEGFIAPSTRERMLVEANGAALLDALAARARPLAPRPVDHSRV
jgi:uncharacterized protein (TIGR00730 family)